MLHIDDYNHMKGSPGDLAVRGKETKRFKSRVSEQVLLFRVWRSGSEFKVM